MKDEIRSFLPLSVAALNILLALAGEDRHGYGIKQEVARQSGGQCKLGPGTLYDNLERLMTRAVIEEAPSQSANDDPRRRYYRLTPFGRRVLSAEIARLESLVREAKAHLRRPVPGRAP